MKRFYKFLMPLVAIVALALPVSVVAQTPCDYGTITVANSEVQTTTSTYCPAYSFYNYSASEVVVPAESLEGIGEIRSMQFKPTVTTAGSYFSNCSVYLGNTTLTNLSAGWVQDTSMHLVFTGNLNYSNTNWQTITFDSSFTYTGGNLIVLFIRNHGSYSSGATFAAYTSGSQTGRYCYTDGSPVVFGNIPGSASNSTINTLPLYKFTGCSVPVACARVYDLNATDITFDGLTLHWLDTINSGASYKILVNDSLVVTGVSDTFYTFTDLLPNTHYTFGVYADCGSGDSSRISYVSAQTPCLPLDTLPYVMNFEGVSTGTSTGSTFVDCLFRLNNGSQYFGYPYVGSSTYNHTAGGNRGLYWYNNTTTGTYGDYQYVVLPGISTDSFNIADLQLKFWSKASSTSYYPVFEVGVMTNPNDPATFQHVKTINVGNSTVWDEYVTSFESLTDAEGIYYMAIRALRATASWYAYVDDIVIEPQPACPPVVHLNQASATAGAVRITWEPQTGAPASYDYSYNEVGDTANVITGTTTVPDVILMGLTPNTDYEFRVNANCGGDGLGASAVLSISTGSMPCLMIDTTTQDTVIFSNGTSTSSGQLVYSGYGNTVYQTIYRADELAAAGISAGAVMGVDFGFSANSSYAKEFTIFMGNTTQNTFSSSTNMIDPTTMVQVYGPYDYPTHSTGGWRHFDFDTIFEWDGTSNIVVCTFMNQPTGSTHTSSGFSGYYTTSGVTGTSAYRYKDSNPFTVTNYNSTGSGSTSAYRASTHFYMAGCNQYATCAAPLIASYDVTPTSVSLEWMPGGSETSWDIEYRATDTNAWTVAASGVSTTTYTIENLSPATDYVVRVVNACTEGNFSASVNVTTPCMPESLPFYEDFESYATGSGSLDMGPCWYWYHNYYGTQYPYVSTSYAYNSSKSLYMYYAYSSSYASWITLPQFTDSVHTLEINFQEYKTSSNYGYIEVGVMTDPTDINTFTLVEAVQPVETSVWTPMTVNFSNYTGPEGRIALLMRTSNSYYAYIDNIEVSHYSSCPRPGNLIAVHLTNTSAQLSWLAADTNSTYNVKWSTANDLANASDSMLVEGALVADLTGLTPNTTYYAWVSTVCSEEPSSPVRVVFTTHSDCMPVVDFAITNVGDTSATLSWNPNTIGNDATSYTIVVSDMNGVVLNTTTTNNYYFLGGLDTNTTYNVMVRATCSTDSSSMVSGSFRTGTPGSIGSMEAAGYAITYPYYNYSISEQMYTATELSGYGDTLYGIYFMANSAISGRDMKIYLGNTTLDNLGTANYVSSSSMTLVYDTTANIVSGWNLFTFDVPFVRNNAQNLVVLVYDSTGSYESFSGWIGSTSAYTTLYSYRDDSPYSTENLGDLNETAFRPLMRLDANSWSAPSCIAPSIVVSATGESTINVVWNGTSASYNVDYRLISDTNWISAAVATTATSYSITGLAASSQYYIRVTGNCAGGSAAAQIVAHTACGVMSLPYTENFDDYSNNYFARPCWIAGTTNNTISTATYPYVSNLIGEGPSLRLYQGAYVIMPLFNEPLNTMQARFEYLAAYTNVFMLFGYIEDPENINTFHLIDTLYTAVDNVERYFTITLDSLPDDAVGHLMFYTPMPPINYSFIDNLVVELIPACTAPDSVVATNITTTGATISWSVPSNSLAIGYNVLYRAYGDTDYDTVYAATASVTLTGLQHSTTYEVQVYAACDTTGTDVSSMTPIYRFITECDDMGTLPYVENFDNYPVPASYETGVMPNCWNVVVTTGYGSTAPQIYYGNALSGNYSLRMYYLSTVAMPKMATGLDSLQITFSDYITSADYAIVVGVIDTLSASATFHAVDTFTVPSSGRYSFTSYLAAAGVPNGYIAFKNIYIGTYSYSYAYNYIDDVTVSLAPSCLPVTHVSAILDSASSITLDWDDPLPATEWEIAYGTSPLTDPLSGTVISGITAHPYTVTGLSDANTYYFYIRHVCGAGDTSAWTLYGPARCHIVTMNANQTDTVYMCGGAIYDDGGPNGNYSNSQNSTIILMPSTPGSLVSVSGYSYTESSLDYLTIYDGIGTSGSVLFRDNTSPNGQSFTDLISNSGPLTLTFHTDGSVVYEGFEVFVSCIPDLCPVSNIRLNGAVPESTSSVSLLWDGTSTSYQIEYGSAGFAHGAGTLINTTSNSITISGLSSLTNYDFYVRGLCNVGDTGFWHKFSYTTPMCDAVVIVENWDSTMNETSSSYSPVGYSTYNYSYVQTIIDSADLAGVGGDITALGFLPASTSAGTYFTNMDVYMANVSESDLSNNFIHPDSTHQFVHVISSANLSYSSTDWQIHGFDSTFTWDGHSNVMVAFNRQHGSWTSGSSFVAHTHSGIKMRYIYQDSGPYNINTVSGGSTSTTVGDIRLFSCGAACPAPVVNVTNVDYQGADVAAVGSGLAYELVYGTDIAAMGDTMTSATGNFTLSGLTPDMQYFVGVRQQCDSATWSDWGIANFTTTELPCFIPTNLEVTATAFSGATLHWTSAGSATQWVVETNGAGNQRFDTVGTNPYTVTGLYANTQYTASVRAICMIGVVESDWSDTITFTTDACPTVEGIAVSAVTSSGATASWQSANGALGYRLTYGEEGFLESEADRVDIASGTTSYTFSGLLPETEYEFYVQTKCGDDIYSNVTGRTSFITLSASQGIYDVESGTLTLFPNPASSNVTVTVSGFEGEVTVEIVDLNGKRVAEQRTQNSELTIDVTTMAQGAYFVRVTGERQTAVRKLIVR